MYSKTTQLKKLENQLELLTKEREVVLEKQVNLQDELMLLDNRENELHDLIQSVYNEIDVISKA